MSGTEDGAAEKVCRCGHVKSQHDWAYDECCSGSGPTKYGCGCSGFTTEPASTIEEIRASLSVVADTTAGEAGRCGAECPRLLDGPPVFCSLRAGHAGWHEDGPTSWSSAARSGGAQDDGLRGRLEALAGDFDANGNSRALGDPSAAAWHKAADLLRRALAGPDDARQDGAR